MAAHNSKLDDMLRNLEREMLKKVLDQCNTLVEAAKVFGVDPNTLGQRATSYGLNDKPINSMGLSTCVVTKSGYMLGMLDHEGLVDGIAIPELGKWLASGKVRMVMGKDATDFVQQGVAVPAMGV